MMKFHYRLLCYLPTACMQMHGVVKGENKIFKHFLNRYFQVHIRNQLKKKKAIQVQTRPCSDKDFVNPPICLIYHF